MQGAHDLAVDRQRPQHFDVRERDVQEKADRLPAARLAQALCQRNQVVVVHPDQVVRRACGARCSREQPVDALIGLVVLVVVADGVEEVVKQRPQRAVAEAEVEVLVVGGASGRPSRTRSGRGSRGGARRARARQFRRSSRTTGRRATASLPARRPRGRRAPRCAAAPIRGSTRRRGDSQHVLPRPAQSHGAVDDADHAVGLRKVAPQLAACGVDVLRRAGRAACGVRAGARTARALRRGAPRPRAR